MRVLAVGDIVGRAGLEKLKEVLPKVVKENNIDFVRRNARSKSRCCNNGKSYLGKKGNF